jgi:hypothetical protein
MAFSLPRHFVGQRVTRIKFSQQKDGTWQPDGWIRTTPGQETFNKFFNALKVAAQPGDPWMSAPAVWVNHGG